MYVLKKYSFLVFFIYLFCGFKGHEKLDFNKEIKKKIELTNPSYDSESFSYSVGEKGNIDNDKGIISLNGGVVINSKMRPLSLSSDKAKIDFSTKIIESQGKQIRVIDRKKEIYSPRVRVSFEGNKVLFADKVRYNFSTQNGEADNALFLYNNYVIRCQKARMDFDETVYGKNVFFTTCKGQLPSWGFIIKKAIYTNKFIIGKGVGFMFLGRIINLPIPFIYVFPEKRKSGFVYPTGFWFDSYQGFCFDPGFYLYFSECADLLFRFKIFTGGSADIVIQHRYILKGVYRGGIQVSYVISKRGGFASGNQQQKSSDNLKDLSITLNHNHKFKFHKSTCKLIYAANDYEASLQNQQADFSINHSFINVPLFSSIPFLHDYKKNFKNGVEKWTFLETSLGRDFQFWKIFSSGFHLSFKTVSSNEKKEDFFVEDENDVVLEGEEEDDDQSDYGDDDRRVVFGPKNIKKKIKVDATKFKTSSFKDYFTEDYWKKVWDNVSSGVSARIPLAIGINKIKWLRCGLSCEYGFKIYPSLLKKKEEENEIIINRQKKNKENPVEKYEIESLFFCKNPESEKKLAFLNDFSFSLPTDISSPQIGPNFLFLKFGIPLSFVFSPSSEAMHDISNFLSPAYYLSKIKFLKIQKTYDNDTETGKEVDLFSHTVYGNVNNHRSAKVNFGLKISCNCFNNQLISFSATSAYDWLADNKNTFKWKNIDVNITIPLLCGFFYTTSINVYKYKEDKRENILDANKENILKEEGNKLTQSTEEKVYKKGEDVEWDSVTKNFFEKKNFLYHRLGFSLPLWKYNPVKNGVDEEGYSSVNLFKNTQSTLSYNFDYVYNPVKDKNQTIHTVRIDINSQLTREWTLNSNLNFKKKDDKEIELQDFSFQVSRRLCDCWQLNFWCRYNKKSGKKNRNSFVFFISLRPLDSTISALGKEHRGYLRM